MIKEPRIGVGVIVLRNGKLLLGERQGSHGEGCWQFPGGHLEFCESVEECAVREVREETGLEVSNLRPGPYTNDIFEKDLKHYVTLFVLADHTAGEAKVLEPGKCRCWQWFEWDSMPRPLFLPIVHLMEQGYRPL